MLADEEIRKAMMGDLEEYIKALQELSEVVYQEYRLDEGEDMDDLTKNLFFYTRKIEHCILYMLRCIEEREYRK